MRPRARDQVPLPSEHLRHAVCFHQSARRLRLAAGTVQPEHPSWPPTAAEEYVGMMAATSAGGGSQGGMSYNLEPLRPHQLLVACWEEELRRQPSDDIARSGWLSLAADLPRCRCSCYCSLRRHMSVAAVLKRQQTMIVLYNAVSWLVTLIKHETQLKMIKTASTKTSH